MGTLYRWLGLISLVMAGCRATATRPITQPAKLVVPVSDPAEYQIAKTSRAAGEAIFVRTGIGDPYRTGIAYPVFLALLAAYPAELAEDTQQLAERFGFLARVANPASDDPDERAGLPLGMHLTSDPLTGVDMLVSNCLLCHAERVASQHGEQLVVGLGNRRIRIHAYDAALSRLGSRADLDPARLRALTDRQAEKAGVYWPPQYADDFVVATVRVLRERAARRQPFLARVAEGPPGMVATIESFALAMGEVLGRDVPTAARVGWAKIPDVVGYKVRETLSWDAAGIGPKDALVVEADFAAGARLDWFWAHSLQGPSLSLYLSDLRRELRFPGSIDAGLAARGHPLFEQSCARCHGSYAADGQIMHYREQVISADSLAVDTARCEAVSDAYVAAANDPRMTHGLVRVQRTLGYVPPVLSNLWARAPYGHAGQWSSLSVLAQPPQQRAQRFVADLSGALDLARVGVPVRGEGAPLRASESLYDAHQPGRSVAGHTFLATLPEPDRQAIIEYLKTL